MDHNITDAAKHLANALQNTIAMASEEPTNARKMTAIAQLEHARRALLSAPTINNERASSYPTLAELVEDGLIPANDCAENYNGPFAG